MQTERIPSFTPTPRKEQFRIQDPSKYDQTLNWSYCTSSKPTFLYWFSILHFYAPGNEYVLEIRIKKKTGKVFPWNFHFEQIFSH